MLAEAIREALPQENCIYFGMPDDAALEAERLYVGFWTDKGSCDAAAGEFLGKLHGKEIFLFGTAGFGGTDAYFGTVLKRAAGGLDEGNTVIGSYMCQGKMPMAVRARYEKMIAEPEHAPNLAEMIENFDRALSHPDEADLENVKAAVCCLY